MVKLMLKYALENRLKDAEASYLGCFQHSSGSALGSTGENSRPTRVRKVFASLEAAVLAIFLASVSGVYAETGQSRTSAASSPDKPAVQVAQKPYKLTVKIRNPRCPSCLKALKTYLAAQKGVRRLSMDPIACQRARITLALVLESPQAREPILEKIKARDLEILKIEPPN